jgi:broad specificity phosphatase PhoE
MDSESESSERQQTIFVIRHGLGEHNVANAGYLIEDAMLTHDGIRQARQLRSSPAFAEYAQPQLVVASPLRRCMQTAYHAFGPEVPCELMANIMENGSMPCDSANPLLGRALLAECKWNEMLQKYRALPTDWAIKHRKWKESAGARFAETMSWVAARPEERVALVGHHDFFRTNLAVSLQPGEVRTFLLCDGELTCPTDPAFFWRMGDGLVQRKGTKPPATSRSASSSPKLSNMFFTGRRGTTSVTSSPEQTRTAKCAAVEAGRKAGSSLRGGPFRKARSVHGGDFYLHMVKEEQARELEMGKGIAVRGGNSFAGCVILGE